MTLEVFDAIRAKVLSKIADPRESEFARPISYSGRADQPACVRLASENNASDREASAMIALEHDLRVKTIQRINGRDGMGIALRKARCQLREKHWRRRCEPPALHPRWPHAG